METKPIPSGPVDRLVERLRELADCDARAGEPLGACMREAADEIERLQADAARYRWLQEHRVKAYGEDGDMILRHHFCGIRTETLDESIDAAMGRAV